MFDVAKYAKDSDQRVASTSAKTDEDPTSQVVPRSEMRIATRPHMGAVVSDEVWARGVVGSPVVAMPPAQLRRLPLDHRAGFLLSLMDGTTDLPTVIELSAMHEADALHVVRDLFESGVVQFR
jgi:hypothetical protein